MSAGIAAIVFDFDGVIVDSEVGANRVLAECLTEIGLETTFEDCLRDYCGHNWQETVRRIEDRRGAALPADFREVCRVRSGLHFANGVPPVPGAIDFVTAMSVPVAVASSSSVGYLRRALGALGLAERFGAHLYSADGMARGKPHPDIYLAAAEGLATRPERCLAIEDSPVGARAAVAAGMTVVGLLAASHITDRCAHADALRTAGVHHLADSFADIYARLVGA